MYHIHLMAIDDILGRPVRCAIELQFSKAEEAKALRDLIVSGTDLCKGMRLSKKVEVLEKDIILKNQETKKNRKIEWPSLWSYCRPDLVKLIGEKVKSQSYGIKQEDFQVAVVTQNQLWDILKKENWLKKQVQISENDDIALPGEFLHCKSKLMNYLKKTDGQSVDLTSLHQLLNLTTGQVMRYHLINYS